MVRSLVQHISATYFETTLRGAYLISQEQTERAFQVEFRVRQAARNGHDTRSEQAFDARRRNEVLHIWSKPERNLFGTFVSWLS